MTIDIENLAVESGATIFKSNGNEVTKGDILFPCTSSLEEFCNRYAKQVKAKDDKIEKALFDRYEDKDPLANLYTAFRRLPICELMAVIGNTIQELQYYRQKYYVRQSIQMDDFTMPPINLDTIGKAK